MTLKIRRAERAKRLDCQICLRKASEDWRYAPYSEGEHDALQHELVSACAAAADPKAVWDQWWPKIRIAATLCDIKLQMSATETYDTFETARRALRKAAAAGNPHELLGDKTLVQVLRAATGFDDAALASASADELGEMAKRAANSGLLRRPRGRRPRDPAVLEVFDVIADAFEAVAGRGAGTSWSETISGNDGRDRHGPFVRLAKAGLGPFNRHKPTSGWNIDDMLRVRRSRN